MPIAALPKTLTEHTDAVASEVMANFNKLLEVLNGQIDGENLAEIIENALFRPGDYKITAHTGIDAGWLLADGSQVSRTTFAALFARIGTKHGAGNGSTTFNLPDVRGRVLMGVDGAAGRIAANDALGNSGGHQSLQAHSHGSGSLGTGNESGNHAHNLGWFVQARREGNLNVYNAVCEGGNTPTSGVTANHSHPIAGNTADAGAGNGGNLQPYLVGNVLIKT
jgi:microcystin-dependent protein